MTGNGPDRPQAGHCAHLPAPHLERQDSTLSTPSIEFHKIWIEQCAATEDIRQHFGLEHALDYLIGEKLFSFVRTSEQHPEFAAELPAFVAEIRRLFTATQIHQYLDYLERTKFFAPPEPDLEIDDLTTRPKMLRWKTPF